jgi:hypothetical protein
MLNTQTGHPCNLQIPIGDRKEHAYALRVTPEDHIRFLKRQLSQKSIAGYQTERKHKILKKQKKLMKDTLEKSDKMSDELRQQMSKFQGNPN